MICSIKNNIITGIYEDNIKTLRSWNGINWDVLIDCDSLQWIPSDFRRETPIKKPIKSLNTFGSFVISDNMTYDEYRYEVGDEFPVLSEEFYKKYYSELRAFEYPPTEEYLDAVVKDNSEQKEKYISACNAVKLKYPKE
jgi:hypothetical protein